MPHRLDHLATGAADVGGRSASYAVGGRGLPVLFLHGWGLDHRAYRRSLKRLTSRGCRVISPSLPGFGGTAALPLRQRSISGYAGWVADFLDAIDVREPLVVLGHSFGGGIATRLTRDHPDRVRSLVLVNSVGDPQSFRAGPGGRLPGIGLRSLVALAAPMTEALRPSASGAAARRVPRVFTDNLIHDPLAVAHAAWLAMTADLRSDMTALADREVPVMVLWSDRDQVIPLSAFDTFCAAVGADGHVVSGGHSWLLTEPDVFGQVLSNVLQVENARHTSATATASVAQLRSLLAQTGLPSRVVEKRLDGLAPLWLLSASSDVLATDLTLCHPRIKPGEVRAVIRPLDADNAHRLTVVAEDRPGLLADTTAILASEGMSVDSASVMTWPSDGLAMHSLTVRLDGAADPAQWESIGARLRGAAAGASERAPYRGVGRANVVRTGEGDGGSIVRVTAPDGIGLLSTICRWFADRGISVESAGISTVDGIAEDIFVVQGDFDPEALASDLGAARVSPLRRLTDGSAADAVRSAIVLPGFSDVMFDRTGT